MPFFHARNCLVFAPQGSALRPLLFIFVVTKRTCFNGFYDDDAVVITTSRSALLLLLYLWEKFGTSRGCYKTQKSSYH